jgi:hypothetical protein
MTINEIVDAAKNESIERKDAGINRTYHHVYRVPGAPKLSVYLVPTSGRSTSRKDSLRVQFEINGKRVNKESFSERLLSRAEVL